MIDIDLLAIAVILGWIPLIVLFNRRPSGLPAATHRELKRAYHRQRADLRGRIPHRRLVTVTAQRRSNTLIPPLSSRWQDTDITSRRPSRCGNARSRRVRGTEGTP